MFNRMTLVLDDSWVTYWLIPNESGANVVMQDSSGAEFNNSFKTYDLAADAFIGTISSAMKLGFTHVIS